MTGPVARPLIAHVVYSLGTGGLENGLINLINRSPVDKYRHVILCLTQSGEFEKRITFPEVEVIALNKRAGHDLGLYWRIWKTLHALKPAIVHTRNLAALEMQIISLLACRARRVHGEHGRDVNDIDGSNKKYRLLRRLVCPFLHAITTVSRDLERWLVAVVGIPAVKIRQIYNGVDSETFRPRNTLANHRVDLSPAGFLPEKRFVMGTVGRLADVKDQQTLLRAFARLLQLAGGEAEMCRLIIVGNGPRFDDLKREAQNLGIVDYVWMAGDRSDIPELLRMMDVFVLPSLGEGISNTILEAMATGLPVLATRVGGNPELVEDGVNGGLVAVAHSAELATALHAMLCSPQAVADMGRCSRNKIEAGFRWQTTVENYMALYDELLVSGPRIAS